MKLVRFGNPGQEKPGILDDAGEIRDVSAHVDDWSGAALGAESLQKIAALDVQSLPRVPDKPRLGAVVGGRPNFIAIGLNYADHAAEAGMAIPGEPIVFLKAPGSLCGAHDVVEKPRGSTKLDWEVELAIIIGKRAKYVSAADALTHVAGYAICNDVSERAFQLERLGQWTKGKSHDTFGPLGPWLVTADEVADPQDLGLWLDVNGERRQTGSTATMVFDVAHIIAYVSEIMTLNPGDVITTGTPPGVGMGMTPPLFLEDGDVMTLGIDGLGEQRLTVRQV
ncbi:MAG: fumarylacetoacetate hydrolase family protein [Castellaniella sp.]